MTGREEKILRSLRRASKPLTLVELERNLDIDERHIRFVFKNWKEGWPTLSQVQIRTKRGWWANAYYLEERYERLKIPPTREDVRDEILMALEDIGPCGAWKISAYLGEPPTTVQSDLEYFIERGEVRQAATSRPGRKQYEVVRKEAT